MYGRRMLIVDEGRGRFSCRVAGIAVEDGHVLLHRADGEDFWTLPGGHAEMGEDSRSTLAREMIEELRLDVSISHLVFVVENFFDYGGRARHELLLLYKMGLPDGFPRDQDKTVHRLNEGGYDLEFRWQAADPRNLTEINLLPAFLRSRLASLPSVTEHIVAGRLPA